MQVNPIATLNASESIIAKVRNNMLRNGHPKFKPLIDRANKILFDLERQKTIIARNQPEQTLGLAFVVPLAWAGGAAALAAATKWISDAYRTTAEIDETANLSAQYGPDKAAELIRAKKQNTESTVKKILWMLGAAVAGFILLRSIGR